MKLTRFYTFHVFFPGVQEHERDNRDRHKDDNLPSPHRNNYFKPTGARQYNVIGTPPINPSQRQQVGTPSKLFTSRLCKELLINFPRLEECDCHSYTFTASFCLANLAFKPISRYPIV